MCLLPEFLGRRICLQVSEVQVETSDSESQHVLHHLNVLLGIRVGVFACLLLGQSVSPHSVFLGEVSQKLLENRERVVDGNIGSPNTQCRATSHSLCV